MHIPNSALCLNLLNLFPSHLVNPTILLSASTTKNKVLSSALSSLINFSKSSFVNNPSPVLYKDFLFAHQF